MEEESRAKNWVVWALIPVCVIATVLLTKSFLKTGSGGGPRLTEEYIGGNETAAAVDREESWQTEAEPVTTTNKWGQIEAVGSAGGRPSRGNAASVPGPRGGGADPRRPYGKEAGTGAQIEADSLAGQPVKKQRGVGLAYGALTGAVGKAMGNPKVVAALFNNKYVIAGFMSRDSVKAATGSPLALANYLKNPRNTSQFINQPVVQDALNNRAVFNALATSKMVDAMLDTPGGKALLSDPAAVAGIFAANPALAGLITNPNMLNALMNNPKTMGMVGQVGAGR